MDVAYTLEKFFDDEKSKNTIENMKRDIREKSEHDLAIKKHEELIIE
jgi:hypothetical protein